ncbi:hypothetical protein ACF0H5_020305 [Mactra antiquata]
MALSNHSGDSGIVTELDQEIDNDIESLTNGDTELSADEKTPNSIDITTEKSKNMRINPSENNNNETAIGCAINAKENHLPIASSEDMNSENQMECDNSNNNARSDYLGDSNSATVDNGIHSDMVDVSGGCNDSSNLVHTADNMPDVVPGSSVTVQSDGQMTFMTTTSPTGVLGSATAQGTTTMQVPMGMSAFVPAGAPVGICHPAAPGAASPTSSSPVTPPQSGASTPSPNSVPVNNGNQATGHQQHVVHVHINPGEIFHVRVDEQIQHIHGKFSMLSLIQSSP